MKIFLIGLPGCGKTTLGKQLARRLNMPFVDLDDEIMKGERQSVLSIFERLGENYFRSIEVKYLRFWCDREEDYIMATGGGTPCFDRNIDLINESGLSVFLDTSVNEIAGRMMQTDLAKRPMFRNQSQSMVAGRVADLRKQRINFYEKAKVKFSGEDLNPDQIITKLKQLEG